MENTSFMRVEEVAQELGISKSYAYKIVQKLNEELKNKGCFLSPFRNRCQFIHLLVLWVQRVSCCPKYGLLPRNSR